MTLQDMERRGELRPHQTSPQELAELRSVVERDLRDASIPELSSDRRFATAYNAALQLATMVIACSGYRVSTSIGGHHRNTFEALRRMLGKSQETKVDYFDACRRKRNVLDYDRAQVTSETEAAELLEMVRGFREFVENWISENHPHLAA